MLNKLQMESKSDYLLLKKIFLWAFMIAMLGPWNFSNMLLGLRTDLAVQVKSGLWMLENKQLILDDVFSWHENLNWCPHEMGFYLLAGLIYKIGGVYGCILLSCATTLCVCFMFYRENRKHSLLSLSLTIFFFGQFGVGIFYNTRPCVISTPLLLGMMLSIWNKEDTKKCGVYFCACSLILAWFHGGMIPLLFVIYIVGGFVDVVYKDFKRVRVLCIFLLIGFILSLCSPIGVETWTYAAKQSRATDIWAYISEWQHGFLSIEESFLFVGAALLCMLTSGVRRFNRASILKAAYICMTVILFFKYLRFILLMSLLFMFVMPKVFDNFGVWLFKRFSAVRAVCYKNWLQKFFLNYRLRLSKVLLGVSAILTLVISVESGVIFSTLPNNSLNDIASMAGEDMQIVQFIKEKGYNRLYNGYFDGTWLLFNDIKVSQDNRCDLYLEQFSGEQYVNMRDSFWAWDAYVDKYHPDALLLYYTVADGADDTMPDAFRILTEYQQDKYELVFELTTKTRPYIASDKILESGEGCKTLHWFIFEVKENDDEEL